MSIRLASVGSVKNKQDLLDFADRTDEVIFECSSIFPFVLFPDSLIIDRFKVTLITRLFFFSKKYSSILLEDIRFVHASVNPFFGVLTIEMKGLEIRKYKKKIRFLSRRDAEKAQNIITGLLSIRSDTNIDLSTMNVNEMKKMIQQAGGAQDDGDGSYVGPP